MDNFGLKFDFPGGSPFGKRETHLEGTPLISILLPNLNNRRFLEERVESIYRQTANDWELVVVDNHSEDGAWEFLKELSDRDSRVIASQAPREGMYANWNNCIRQAKGKYVYIATSDDTMAEDCLEKLSTVLEGHAECSLAHCPLKLFDQHSREKKDNWWWNAIFAQSTGEFIRQRHIRKAPFDGLLHLSGDTVYISITQLLIRRSLFDKIGLFPTNRGSIGDFQWDMKAALTTDTIHVPDTWGGWRQHESQATARSGKGSLEHLKAIEEMSWCALSETKGITGSFYREFVENGSAMHKVRRNRISMEFDTRIDLRHGLVFLAGQVRCFPHEVVELILEKLARRVKVNRSAISTDWLQFLKKHGIEGRFIAIQEDRM